MSEIAGSFQSALSGSFSKYPVPTSIVIGLAVIGLFHFTINFLSYFNMLAELFILPGTDVSSTQVNANCLYKLFLTI